MNKPMRPVIEAVTAIRGRVKRFILYEQNEVAYMLVATLRNPADAVHSVIDVALYRLWCEHRWEFERRGYRGTGDTTLDFAQAGPCVEGTMNWDGCTDLKFGNEAGTYLHFCGEQSLAWFRLVLNELFSFANELRNADDSDEAKRVYDLNKSVS